MVINVPSDTRTLCNAQCDMNRESCSLWLHRTKYSNMNRGFLLYFLGYRSPYMCRLHYVVFTNITWQMEVSSRESRSINCVLQGCCKVFIMHSRKTKLKSAICIVESIILREILWVPDTMGSYCLWVILCWLSIVSCHLYFLLLYFLLLILNVSIFNWHILAMLQFYLILVFCWAAPHQPLAAFTKLL